MLEIEAAGHRLGLLPDRAIWWGAGRGGGAVIVADAHFCKPASFRALGVAVPESITGTDLARLDGLIERFNAARLIILGDFLHSAHGRQPEAMDQIAAWRARRGTLRIDLVRGNHDLSAGDPPEDWRIECHAEPWLEGGLAFAHEPMRVGDAFALCGHIHPGVVLSPAATAEKARARKTAGGRVRAPCFWFTEHFAVLPAFGSFTGVAPVWPSAGHRIYAAGQGEVIEVTLSPQDSSRARSGGSDRVRA